MKGYAIIVISDIVLFLKLISHAFGYQLRKLKGYYARQSTYGSAT